MQWSVLLILLLWLLPLLGGCGPAVPEEELGTVTKGLPKVPDADMPYEIPQLDVPPTAEVPVTTSSR